MGIRYTSSTSVVLHEGNIPGQHDFAVSWPRESLHWLEKVLSHWPSSLKRHRCSSFRNAKHEESHPCEVLMAEIEKLPLETFALKNLIPVHQHVLLVYEEDPTGLRRSLHASQHESAKVHGLYHSKCELWLNRWASSIGTLTTSCTQKLSRAI